MLLHITFHFCAYSDHLLESDVGQITIDIYQLFVRHVLFIT